MLSSAFVAGIFDRNESLSPLHNVNKVYIGYCTSDAYMGDRPASKETYGWAFRGQRVVEEVIQVGICSSVKVWLLALIV